MIKTKAISNNETLRHDLAIALHCTGVDKIMIKTKVISNNETLRHDLAIALHCTGVDKIMIKTKAISNKKTRPGANMPSPVSHGHPMTHLIRSRTTSSIKVKTGATSYVNLNIAHVGH